MSFDETKLNQLQDKLQYKYKDISLLQMALTHSSYANENKKNGAVSNERLEFLGDSVLGMTVAELIYRTNPQMTEGQMTRLRSELVCEKSLATLAAKLRLGDCLMLGRGEEKGGGRIRSSILADAVESIIASIYIDGGFRAIKRFISKHFAALADSTRFEATDYKTALQEVIQVKSGQFLSYRTIDESGPDHMKIFTVKVMLNDVQIGSGSGPSKKEAEQMAAKSALSAYI